METKTKSRQDLKHLAAYLPYNLKLLYDIRPIKIIDLEPSHFSKNWDANFYSQPILRPLSDLDKYYVEFKNNRPINLKEEDFNKLFKMCTTIFQDIKSAPHYFIEQLLEKHFDIYYLIPKGLAVNINTIE